MLGRTHKLMLVVLMFSGAIVAAPSAAADDNCVATGSGATFISCTGGLPGNTCDGGMAGPGTLMVTVTGSGIVGARAECLDPAGNVVDSVSCIGLNTCTASKPSIPTGGMIRCMTTSPLATYGVVQCSET